MSPSERPSRMGLVICFLPNDMRKPRDHRRLRRKFNDLRKMAASRDGYSNVVKKSMKVSPVMRRHPLVTILVAAMFLIDPPLQDNAVL
jgi:hypothetical protein